MPSTIAVDALQIGMFIHLDMGWMAHPFPLSSFKIASADQIATIRSLGLTRVRWSASRSDAAPPMAEPGVAPKGHGESKRPDAEDDAAARRHAQADALNGQRAAVRRCEKQFAEAAQDLKRATHRCAADPIGAGDDAQRLAGALLNKMGADGELCVRVLVESAGDRATAHALNVTVLALLMGRMFGLPNEDLLAMATGALMHDVGKLDLPERARHVDIDQPSSEALLYRDHVALGVARAKRMQLPPQAQQVVAQHHEAADGSGFPRGLGLDQMSTASRVVALVNRYDSLCNAAPPRRSLTPHEALSKLFAQSRSKFDNTMLNGFIRMMGIYPPGSVVQLTDDRYAMVMSVNSSRPLKPTVLVCDPGTPSHQALHVDLEKAVDLGIRRSLKVQQLPPAAAEFLRPRPRVAYFFDRMVDQAGGRREAAPLGQAAVS
jgi:putative nucleotidyltransferase with HDIG domain